MRMFQDLSVYRKLAEHVARSNQLTSFLHLARRAKVTDDAARRSLERLKAEFNDPLIAMKDHRLVLTEPGRELQQLAARLSALADNTEPPPDVLTVEVDTLLAHSVIPAALAAFVELWGGMVQPRICPLLEDGTQRNVQEGVAFAVGFASLGQSVSSDEALGPKLPWVLVLAKNHRLAGTGEPIIAEGLTANDRVFIPELATDWPGMDSFLKAVPSCNRILCDSTLAVRLAASSLGGSAIVPDALTEKEFITRQIQGLEPVQPRFFFRRRGIDGMTEPERSLVEQIKLVAAVRSKRDMPPEAKKEEEDVFEELVEETVTPLEGVLS